jgi:hypothetical protein
LIEILRIRRVPAIGVNANIIGPTTEAGQCITL